MLTEHIGIELVVRRHVARDCGRDRIAEGVAPADNRCTGVKEQHAARSEPAEGGLHDPDAERLAVAPAAIAIRAPRKVEHVRRVRDHQIDVAVDRREQVAVNDGRRQAGECRVHRCEQQRAFVDVGEHELACPVSEQDSANAGAAADAHDTRRERCVTQHRIGESIRIRAEEDGVLVVGRECGVDERAAAERREPDRRSLEVTGAPTAAGANQRLPDLRRQGRGIEGRIPAEDVAEIRRHMLRTTHDAGVRGRSDGHEVVAATHELAERPGALGRAQSRE